MPPFLIASNTFSVSPFAFGATTSGVMVMTFNVENLFDTIDDPKKEDQDFLPLAQKGTKEHREICEKQLKEEWKH